MGESSRIRFLTAGLRFFRPGVPAVVGVAVVALIGAAAPPISPSAVSARSMAAFCRSS